MRQDAIVREARAGGVVQGSEGSKLSGVNRGFRAGEPGDATSRRALNALAVTSNLVAALIEHPGPNSDHESMVDAARTMLRCADQTTQALVEDLGLGGLPWARHRIMRMVAGAVADRWSTTSRQGGMPSADVSAFIPVWKEMASQQLPAIVIEDPAIEAMASLRIAMLDAMQPVMREVAIFDMLHDPKKAAAHARDTILAASQKALTALLALEPVSERSRGLMMQALLRNAGSIYASSWRRHAEDTVGNLQAMDLMQQTAVIESNKDGLTLHPIDCAFEGSFVKLVEMVQFLSAGRDSHPSEECANHAEFEEELMELSAVGVGVGGRSEG